MNTSVAPAEYLHYLDAHLATAHAQAAAAAPTVMDHLMQDEGTTSSASASSASSASPAQSPGSTSSQLGHHYHHLASSAGAPGIGDMAALGGASQPQLHEDADADEEVEGDGDENNKEKWAKRHMCDVPDCGKSFDSKWALIRHIRVHTGEKPFPCTYPDCDKSFAEKSAMTRHLQTHSRDKPYKCTYPGCTKSFKGKDYLEFHLKIHAEGNPYACEHPSCSKTFCSPKSLKKHIRLWHNPGGKSTSMEQQLRERIIKMATRNKEKTRKFESTIRTLMDENEALKRRIAELEAHMRRG